MNKKRYWIMDMPTIENFNNYRMEKYKAVAGQKFDLRDEPLTRYYVNVIAHMFRRRKASK